MALLKKSKIRNKFGISDDELKAIRNFIQGAIYCWVKNQKDKFFAVRDLMGGDNYEWEGTPLYCLYKKHINKGKSQEKAIKEAGKDLGWILKSVLNDDKRIFDSCDLGKTKGYKWIKQ